ncbi:MAG: hypothetical protein HYY16_05290 [Planctomycetes bacterium]|nr:hypothetical protein [Planctomycetota bacterium]
MTVACPICRLGDFVVHRRRPMSSGIVEKHCTCQRCGAGFVYQEDRTGRPVKK